MIDDTLFEAEEKMDKAVTVAREDFSIIRTGRAHPSMFNKITVEYYGSQTPVNQLASFHVPEPRMVVIQPFDKGSLGAIERAIRNSDLGVNPANDGTIIRIVLPELTQERRREYIKTARSKAEDGRVAIRNIRRHAKDILNKMIKSGDAPEDDVHRAERELDELTHTYEAQVDELLKHKDTGFQSADLNIAPAVPQLSPPPVRAGRNLPVAIGVGAALGGLVILTLLTVKATFLLYVGVALAIALSELAAALAKRDINIPVIPVAAGGAATLTCMYWLGPRDALAALALTVIAIFAWRLPGGPSGYVKDVTAGVFATIYIPFLASFVVAMLMPADGPRRVLTFVILTVCSDIGGFAAGITLGRGGRHLMAPAISPKKTWEGFAGSVVACPIRGALCLPLLLHGHAWQGLLTGAAAVLAAILGDLVESMIKRDLDIKDMGSLLPGHGGVLERLDSLLAVAPVVWLMLVIFVR